MEKRLESMDSKEVLGGLETNFTITKSSSEDVEQNRLSLENNQTEGNNDQDNILSKTEKIEVSNVHGSNRSLMRRNSGSSTPKGSLEIGEVGEEAYEKNVRMPKSVSFRKEVIEEFDLLSQASYVSLQKSVPDQKQSQGRISISSFNNLQTGLTTTTSRKIAPVLEDIPEVDENVSEIDATPGYYGWDGYEARFEERLADRESWTSIPKCVPPWAKSMRKKYGLSPSLDEDRVAESNKTMQAKLENLMKKHKDLMLLKRVESKKQLIVEPSKDPTAMDTVQMRAKSTRYYMTPLVFDGAKKSIVDRIDENEKVSLPSLSVSDSVSFTKKTPRPQAKKEISQVLKSLQKSVPKKNDSIKDHEYKVKKEDDKCAKITLSNIREFVNMSPDERKLHEIIKIEKVPSVQDLKERGKPSSKYIINVPKDTATDKPTVNVIKIKEKRKLRVDSIENIEEKVTELRYNQDGTRRHAKGESKYIDSESSRIEPIRHIKTSSKSPTETKTFEVKTRQTPLLAPLINEEDKKTEKVLLLQYDKKSKKDKHTTQLLGIKEPSTSHPGEMYLYGSETEGKRVKENLTTGQEIPLTLKDKVHSIFEELRGLTLKQNVPTDSTSAHVQASPTVESKVTQRPSHTPATDVAMVEAKPEVRSAAVQVRQSQILEGKADSFELVTPYPTPSSEFQGPDKIRSSLKKDKLEDLVLDKALLEKPLSIDKGSKEEKETEPELLKELQEVDKIAGVESKSESTKLKESVDQTKKEEKKETELVDETKEKVDLTPSQELKEKEIISKDDDTKETTEEAQKDTHSESSRKMTKELSKEKSKEPNEQLGEEKQSLSSKDEIRKLSKTSSKVSGQKSTLPPQSEETDFKAIPTVFSEEIKKASADDDEGSGRLFKMSLPKEYEDIRSYEFGSQQGTELVIKSSSKFLHKKDDLRKKMNWTNDTIFLENNTCPQLIRGLAETAMRRPADPISFLAHWIYKDCESRERREQEEVRDEHLQLARAMAEVAGGDAKTRKKFNVKKYPVSVIQEEKQIDEIGEEGEFPEDNLENTALTNEIIQEA